MDASETWVTLISSVVIPIILRVLVHFWPWLAEAIKPETLPQPVGPAPATDPSTPAEGDVP